MYEIYDFIMQIQGQGRVWTELSRLYSYVALKFEVLLYSVYCPLLHLYMTSNILGFAPSVFYKGAASGYLQLQHAFLYLINLFWMVADV